MEKQPPIPMTPFDTLVTSPELQMMKLMLPYTPASYQRILAFYIKFIELQNTMRYFGLFREKKQNDPFCKTPSSPAEILGDLKPYIGKDADTIDMILSAMSMMDMMKEMDMPDFSQMGDMSGMMDMMNLFSGQNDTAGHTPDAENKTKNDISEERKNE